MLHRLTQVLDHALDGNMRLLYLNPDAQHLVVVLQDSSCDVFGHRLQQLVGLALHDQLDVSAGQAAQ